jgi:hypothetical protein
MTDVANADRLRVKPAKASPSPHRPGATSRIAELQVSAHLMTLETGLFCVFQTPGSPPPDPVTALPGVRITPAPGLTGRPEAVDVSTFREDGWLAGTAALVRVTDGSAQILVTIYQLKGAEAAPQLQVLRLSGEAAKAEAVAAPAGALPPVAAGPPPAVIAHVQSTGDVGGGIGAWIGTKGSRLWIEGFGVTPPAGVAAADLEYQGVLGRNWLSPWVAGGQYCGSRGMALPLLGLRLRLKGAAAKAYECSYAASFVDGSTAGPVGAGEACEAPSLAALEAFQIVIRPREAPAEAAARPVVAARPVGTKKLSQAALPPAKSSKAKAPALKRAAKTRG